MSDQSTNRSQNIILEERSKLSISGVEQVDNYNENTITLGSVRGGITIKGEELNISKLNLEDGNVRIDGIINSISYSNKESTNNKGTGFLGKMFK